MLTRRVKAYSSFWSQNVSLSPAISSQFILGVCAATKDLIKTLYFESSGSFKIIGVDTTEKLVTSAWIGSMPMLICNRFHERLANNGKITTFTGVPLFDALDRTQVSLNLENRNRRNLCSMVKISYAACLCLSQLVSVQFALEMCLAAWNRQKSIEKTSVLALRSSKVIEFGGNREPVYDFLLMINSR